MADLKNDNNVNHHPPFLGELTQMQWLAGFLLLVAAVAALVYTRNYSYLLFHSLVELLTICAAFAILLITWNSRLAKENSILNIVGIGFCAAAVLDLVHMLAFKGMNLFQGYTANLPTQLWIAARYLQAVTFLIAPLLYKKMVSLRLMFFTYATVIILMIWAIFSGNFPECYQEGAGLTEFKIFSEYVIIVIMLVATFMLHRCRSELPEYSYRMIIMSSVCMIAAEFAFTKYVGVSDLANLVGHLFKLAAFYLLYRAVYVVGIKEPYLLICNELGKSEKALRAAYEAVQKQVEEKTKELKQSERSLLSERKRLTGIIKGTNAGTWEWNIQTGEVVFNDVWANIIGYTLAELSPVSINTWMTLAHPDDLKVGAELLEKHFKGELEYYECEHRMKHKNGSWVWILDRGAVSEWTDDGKPLMMMGTHQDITERKSSEVKLKESEGRFKSIFIDHSAVMLLINPIDLTIVDANRAAEMFYGYNRDKLLQMKISDINALPLDVITHETRAAQTVNKNIFEFKHRLASGEVRIVEVHSSPIEHNERTLLFSVIHDITDRKQVEDKLIEAINRYDLATKGGGIGVWDWYIEENRLVWDEHMYHLYGVTPDRFSGAYEAWLAGLHPDDRMQGEESIRQAFYENKDFDIEFRVVWPDGAIRHIKGIAVVQRDDTGTPVRMTGVNYDITERVNAELLLQKSEQELRESLSQVELFRNLVDSSGDCFYMVDLDDGGRMCYVNDAAVRHYGASREEICTWHIPDWDPCFTVDTVPQLIEMIEKTQKLHMESLHRIVDGSIVPVEITVNYIKPPNSHRIAYGWFSNITARIAAAEELLKAKESAESANRAKSEFLANMSHEIRTPMNGVLGMAQLLAMTDLTKEQKEYVDTLAISSKSLLSILNDILDLSKIESGKVSLEIAEFSLNGCVNDVVLTQKSVVYHKGLSLNVKISDDIPNILLGDQLRIKQILLNLLGNAVKFTPKGNISVCADVLQKSDATVTIQLLVQDTGIGISSESLEKIFKPFTQENSSTTRLYGGTGLGLTISRRLAELMNGSISVESVLGIGSSFKLTVPLSVGSATAVKEQTQTSLANAWKGDLLRVLLVEDNPINSQLGILLLKKIGHEVALVGNGKDCLDALSKSSYDLVLMDIQMPIMNGEDALREIRKNEQGTSRHQPVIALTAYSLRGEQERFLAEGFDGFISKPLDAQELLNEMMRVMAHTHIICKD